MATYKVIQDIEAEDKFVGPLTLKQFIFAGSALFFGYLDYFFGVALGLWFLMILFTPFMLLGAFLAFPWSKEQSTEVWVLAKIRFKIKPQVRIWDQSGLEQLVTITVPKKIEKQLTNGLDQFEVESRLKALAETIDTRGWATKNATINTSYARTVPGADERLINPATIPQQVPEENLAGYTDVLDDHDLVSENFQQMIQTSQQMHRQQSLDRMEEARHAPAVPVAPEPVIQYTPPPEAYVQPPTAAQQQPAQTYVPAAAPIASSIDEAALAAQLRSAHQARDTNSHMRTLPTITPQPVARQVPDPVVVTDADVAVEKPQAPMTKVADAGIIDLSRNNDLNIETIARQANKNKHDDGEVVISLH